MRIAVIVTGGLHPSGREQVVPSWLALFSRLGRRHDVHAFALRHLPQPSRYNLLGFTVHDLGRPAAPFGLTPWAQHRALNRAMRAAGPFDVVHGFWPDPAGALAVRIGRAAGIPSVVTCDSGEFVALPDIAYGSQRTPRGRARVLAACSGASCVHVCTSFMAQLARSHGFDARVIPLGVEVTALPTPHGQIQGPPWHLLQVASLSGVKDQASLIEAVARLAPTHDVHLDLVGEDTLGGSLEDLARRRGVDRRVTFHGFLPHDRLAALRSRAHLYVQSSRHEAAGVAVLEAAACGLPVVGTRVGYVSDWAPEGAVAVDASSPGALAEAIASTLANPAHREAIGAAAFSFARAHDADWTAGAFERMYEDLRM